ncbi:Ir94f [Drosophila busckii]|uniref:Ir94f n=1 Tax=Drosophila busckii TaxID=30019 RepID=A0A0M3QXF5_DROBS|nr:uncharacterized protein LOC108601320 [Drosophila busckii]ALC45779.1 Ir94f [Drosophila busckii]
MWMQQLLLSNVPLDAQLAAIWTHLRAELSFSTLIYFKAAAHCDCWLGQLLAMSNATAATLVWNSSEKAPYLKPKQNVDMLGLICLDSRVYELLLNELAAMLDYMREVPLLIQLCAVAHKTEAEVASAELLIYTILERCQQLLMPNVLVLFEDFFATRVLYAYQNFPTFNLLAQTYSATLQLYPNKLLNLYGHMIRTAVCFDEPYAMAYRLPNGTQGITGVVWLLLIEFARQLNGTLQLVSQPSAIKSIRGNVHTLMKLIANNSLDIAITVQATSLGFVGNLKQMSYPALVGSWCIMLPVEHQLTTREAMLHVMQSHWTWLYLALLYAAFCWLQRQRLLVKRILRLLPPLMQLTLLCVLVAQLAALLARPAQRERVNSIADMSVSIAGLRSEFNIYPDRLRIKYPSSFTSFESIQEFIALRKSLNTSFAYTISSPKFALISEMQQFFERPLFRYSTDICLKDLTLTSLLIQSNYLNRHQLNLFIIQLRDSGLTRYWVRLSFYHMLRDKQLQLKDFTPRCAMRSVSCMDWIYIAWFYALAVVAAVLVFLAELTVYYSKTLLNLV